MNIPKTYIPKDYEADIYALWEKAKAFAPQGKDSYAMVMPPPNANGNLHMGHALTNAIQDTIIRYQRMQGVAALYLPGADHAGFETWVVYERELNKQGKTRFDFKREELYSQVWDFVEKNKSNMQNQLKALGASCDWDQFTYTLDDQVVNTAYDTFKKLWDDGLVYRGEKLVNYCTSHQTSFSDIEVEYIDQAAPLFYMKYGPFTLATTRPETKFGDTAVAVHPEDTRYQKYIGQEIEVEGLNGPFKLSVIADEMVDPQFGSGVVKITPAHDFNDYEVAVRHGLPMVSVIDNNGLMNEKAGKYKGMKVKEARIAVVKDLAAKNMIVKVDQDYQNRVGVCYKCGTVIEPLLKDQWFIKVQPLAEKAIQALEKGEITYYPDSRRVQTINYLKEVRDWNISRQIAWGIPIPAFKSTIEENNWIFNTDVNQETIDVNGVKFERDPDVFDTWFSSGQWPFATLGYPNEKAFKTHYPLAMMETGFDIMYQWVARMIMLGIYTTGKVPFKEVYLHGLVLDGEGQKMSKSKGNVINPMELIEKYGSDAVRMGLLTGRSPGVNQAFTEDKLVGARNFANKLWNVARFLSSKKLIDPNVHKAKANSSADEWIIARCSKAIEDVTRLLDSYRLSEAYEHLYHFVWDDFADWYIEVAKVDPNKSVLSWVFNSVLRLAHPFAPFVTETIYQELGGEGELILQTWPIAQKPDEKKIAEFKQVQSIISEIRNIQTDLESTFNDLYHKHEPIIQKYEKLICALAHLHSTQAVKDGNGVSLTQNNIAAWLDVDKATIQGYVENLKKKRKANKKQIEIVSTRLENKGYVESAPKELVQQSKDQLASLKAKAKTLEIQINRANDDIDEIDEEAEEEETRTTGNDGWNSGI